MRFVTYIGATQRTVALKSLALVLAFLLANLVTPPAQAQHVDDASAWAILLRGARPHSDPGAEPIARHQGVLMLPPLQMGLVRGFEVKSAARYANGHTSVSLSNPAYFEVFAPSSISFHSFPGSGEFDQINLRPPHCEATADECLIPGGQLPAQRMYGRWVGPSPAVATYAPGSHGYWQLAWYDEALDTTFGMILSQRPVQTLREAQPDVRAAAEYLAQIAERFVAVDLGSLPSDPNRFSALAGAWSGQGMGMFVRGDGRAQVVFATGTACPEFIEKPCDRFEDGEFVPGGRIVMLFDHGDEVRAQGLALAASHEVLVGEVTLQEVEPGVYDFTVEGHTQRLCSPNFGAVAAPSTQEQPPCQ